MKTWFQNRLGRLRKALEAKLQCLYSKTDPLPTAGHPPEVWASPASHSASTCLPARKDSLASWDIRQADNGSGGSVRSRINTSLPGQWWMRNGRGCEEGQHVKLASRKAARRFHKHYAICFCEATKRLVLITSFSRLEDCNSEKADDFSFKKAAAWPPNPPSFHHRHRKVSCVKPWWWQVGDLGCYTLLLWVSVFPSVVVYL